MRIKRCLSVFLCILAPIIAFPQSISMVADLNTTQYSFEEPHGLFVLKDKLFFNLGNNTVYAFDGMNSAAIAFSLNHISSVTVLHDEAYILTDDPNGSAIWKYDGENPPGKILGIAYNSKGNFPRNLTWYNNKLYYTITKDSYDLLWEYDQVNQPHLVDSIMLGGMLPNIKKILIFNNLLYLIGADQKVYTSDGIHKAVINQNAGSVKGNLLMEFNNKLYYQSIDSISGNVLAEYDGINPRVIVMDLEENKDIVNSTIYKNKFYFGVSDYWYDKHLWAYDGINPPIVRDDVFEGIPDYMGIFDNKLYLTIGGEVHAYDGESTKKIDNGNAGHIWTVIVFKDRLYYGTHVSHGGSTFWINDGVHPPEVGWLGGSNGSKPSSKIVFNNELYFAANGDNLGYDLWGYDGTKPEIKAEINYDYPFKIISATNKLFLVSPHKIWAYDGPHPVMEKDMISYVNIDNAYTYNDRLYFFLHEETDSLMSFDGTSDPVSLANNRYAEEIIGYHNKIYFIASDTLFGFELRVVNEDNSVSLVTDFRPGKLDSYPGNLTLFNDKLYFTALDELDNTCLWAYDGINPPVKTNFNSGTHMNSIEGLTILKDQIYCLVDHNQLWSYNEIKGSSFIKDSLPLVYLDYPKYFEAINEKLYFVLRDNQFQCSLWEYDGIHVPKPITNAKLTAFGNLTFLKNALIFRVFDANGYYTWKYDGFNTPGRLIQGDMMDLNENTIADLLSYNNKLYFTARSFLFGEELFAYTPPDSTINIIECGSYDFNGITLKASGTYYDTIPGKAGNDSIVELNLLIIHPTQSDLSINACNSFVSPSGKHVWTSNGIYKDTIPNSVGCDSLITLHLNLDQVDTSVVQDHSVLISNDADADHQWIDCDNANIPIPGETYLTYTALKNGHYAVIVSEGACVDTSAVYEVIGTGINGHSGSGITLYPNPTSGTFTIDLGRIYPEATVTITGYDGRLILKEVVKNTSRMEKELDEPCGIYILTIQTDLEDRIFKIIKD